MGKHHIRRPHIRHPKTKKGWGITLVIVIIAILATVFSMLAYFAYVNKASTLSELGFTVIDSRAGVTLKNPDVSLDLYGLKAGKPSTSWSNFELIRSSTADQVRASDFDDSLYGSYLALFNATDDGLDEDTYDDGDVHTLGNNQAWVTNGANTLYVYQVPSNVSFVLVNSYNGTVTAHQGNGAITGTDLNTQVNFTAIIILNASEPDSAYVRYFDYQTQLYVAPKLTLTFAGATVTDSTATFGGLTADTQTTANIDFWASQMVGDAIGTYNYRWSDDAISAGLLYITKAVFSFA